MKWAVYTVLLGLTPILTRILIISLTSNVPFPSWIQSGDIISFGLILVITNINILEHEKHVDEAWKTRNIGISLLLTVLFAALFAATCFHELNSSVLDINKIKAASVILSLSSGIFSYAIWDHLAYLAAKEGQIK
jgi:branched-subunit amino acid transport protein